MNPTITTPDVLHGVVERVELLDRHTYRTADHVASVSADDPLEAALTGAIYSRLYLGLADETTDPDDRRLATSREDASFVPALIEAEGGRTRWEPGWRVMSSDGTHAQVRSDRDGLYLVAAADQVRPARHEPGDRVEIAFPTERRFVSPGFYLTSGVAGPAPAHRRLLRWYLNAPPSSAVALLGALTRRLDAAGLAYTLKTLNDPSAVARPDAMVLYTARESACASHVRAALDATCAPLRTAVPLFTRPLAPGLAIADELDDRNRRLSFGQHRSLLLARGVIAAGPRADAAARHDRVVAAFTAAGVDHTRPHLGPGARELDLPGWSA